ncbi:ribosomal RNA-processing protein 8 [Topomyia yanbarensis]|uniref:ribosomal RNA-processing protein 8 n=1 Tax=Topomyia yanbarensis TaxID=2498891 RepID=UPI00273A8F43|nr:ribosomal RNA-processing protein 8 [Topomyia yanbarensis]
MDKIFQEHPWDEDDTLTKSEQTNYSFPTLVSKKSQNKRAKDHKKQHSNEPGRFVRTSLANDTETNTIIKGKTKSRKRRADEPLEKIQDEIGQYKIKKQNLSVEKKSTAKQKGEVTPKLTAAKLQSTDKSTNFRDRLVDSLKGSRFRFLNEQLYRNTGEEAKTMFQQDPGAFQAYHEGYRHQIEQWSVNPLDRIIKNIHKLPKSHVVADFGCGEARLATAVPHKVYSLDLVASNDSVIACNMANTPLETNSINVAVFCLSLMGTNLRDFLLEANRVMKIGAILKIAEVSSRFDNVKEFIDCVHKCGFLLDNKDLKHKLFYFFNFKKVRTVAKNSLKGKHFSLKPCLYKKR